MITGGSGGGVIEIGSNVSLSCTASGDESMTYSYQWLKYDGEIVGETSPVISFSPLREADVGQYNCRVSDDFLTTISDSVVIDVEGE